MCSYRAVKWVDPDTVNFDGTSNVRTAGEVVNDLKIDSCKLLFGNDLCIIDVVDLYTRFVA